MRSDAILQRRFWRCSIALPPKFNRKVWRIAIWLRWHSREHSLAQLCRRRTPSSRRVRGRPTSNWLRLATKRMISLNSPLRRSA